MIRFLFLVIFVLVAGIVGLAFVPIATALKYSGVVDNGVQWASAKGTILNGHLEGLMIKGAAYGDAELKLDIPSVLEGRPRYAVDWTGDHGEGSGKVSVSSGPTIALEDYIIKLDLLAYPQTARWIQKSGGQVKLEGAAIRFKGSECLEALGAATSDVLDLNRDILGAGWSELRGDLSCEDGKLLVPLESENASGTRFLVRLRAAPGYAGKFEARVAGFIPRTLNFALPLAGFARDGEEFVYLTKRMPAPTAAP